MRRYLLCAVASGSLALANAASGQVATQSGAGQQPQAGTAGPTGVTPSQAPDADEANAPSGDIVVTGSRTITDGSKAPTPVTVASAEQLQLAAPQTVADGLNQLPEFRGSTRPSNGTSGSNNSDSGAFLNLRNLGAQRTLLLLDGHRAPPSTTLGTVDTNVLPQELISRVDVVTGGASAAYGSDAVAGVVNFVLDTRFKGLKGSVQAGVTTYGDDGTQKATLAAGTDFAGGRGRIVASGSYYNSDGVPSTFDRPWGSARRVVLTDPANPTQSIIVSNYANTLFTPGGLIYGGGTLGLGTQQFAPGGQVVPFNRGTVVNGAQVGGQGALLDLNAIAAVRAYNGFAHGEYDVTDRLTVYAEGLYASTRNSYNQVPNFFIPGFNAPTILSGNPYLPASLQAQLTAQNLPGFILGRYSFDMPTARGRQTNETYNLVGGARYKLPGDWQLEGYYERSQNVVVTTVSDDLNYPRFFAAVDAVRNPANGQIVCRTTLTAPNLYPGCVPINLLGAGSPSAAAIAYVHGQAYWRARVVQQVGEISVSGSPFSLPGGPLRIAVSGEYRKDTAVQSSDTDSHSPVVTTGLIAVPAAVLNGAGRWQLGNVQPLSGSFDVKEIAGEVNAPLTPDGFAIGAISLNGAVRYTSYSISGGVTTWKAGAVWKPVSTLTVRGTISEDIRAPNLNELFSGSVQNQVTVRDTRNNVTAGIISSAVGSTNLDPERARTYTGGAVFTGLRGLTLSADYFNIDVHDVISQLTPQQTVDACTASAFTSAQCANLVYTNPTASTGLVRVFTPKQNLSYLKTSGLDFEADYDLPLDRIGAKLPGRLQLRALATYLLDYTIGVPGGGGIDFTGVVGTSNNPKLTALASATYSVAGVSLYVQERVIGKGHFQASSDYYNPPLANNDIPAVWYTDLTVKANIGDRRRIEVFGTINNVFNRYPPIIPLGSFQLDYPTNASLYDVAGRTITGGARFRF